MRLAEPTEPRVVVLSAGRAGGAEVRVEEVLVGAPTLVEVILGARAVGAARPGLAVDEEHIVAFAVPDGRWAVDVVVHPGEVTLSFAFAEQIVVRVGGVFRRVAKHAPFVFYIACTRFRTGELLVVPSVEAAHVFRN